MSTLPDKIKLFCIVCDKALINFMEDDAGGIQPDEGSAFDTYGHYGSTITDFMNGTRTTICVCDDCLSKALSKKVAWIFDGQLNDG